MKRLILVVGGLAVALLLAFLLLRTDYPSPVALTEAPPLGDQKQGAHAPPTPTETRAVTAPVSGEAPREAEAPRVKGQIPLERPPVPAAGLRAIPQPAATTGPIDRRENPGPRAKQELEMIHYAFDTLDEDIAECLQQWDATPQDGGATEVMIAFEIDADGLQKSWLEHEGEIPFGPRTCLANAVYGLDWSHIVDHPAKVSNRFTLGRDAGP
jgi:hypothetical protein